MRLRRPKWRLLKPPCVHTDGKRLNAVIPLPPEQSATMADDPREPDPQTPKPQTFSAKKVNVAEKGVLEIEDGKGNAMRFKVPRSWKKDWEKIGEALFGGKL